MTEPFDPAELRALIAHEDACEAWSKAETAEKCRQNRLAQRSRRKDTDPPDPFAEEGRRARKAAAMERWYEKHPRPEPWVTIRGLIVAVDMLRHDPGYHSTCEDAIRSILRQLDPLTAVAPKISRMADDEINAVGIPGPLDRLFRYLRYLESSMLKLKREAADAPPDGVALQPGTEGPGESRAAARREEEAAETGEMREDEADGGYDALASDLLRRGAPVQARLLEFMRDRDRADVHEVATEVHGDPETTDNAVRANVMKVNRALAADGIPVRLTIRSGIVFKSRNPG